jgi:hypothetical protein
VKADGASDGVDEDGVGNGAGDDAGQVDFEEIGRAEDWTRIEVANTDEYEENDGEEMEEGDKEAEKVMGTLSSFGRWGDDVV